MIFMEVRAEVIGKPEPKNWKNDNGSGITYRLNIGQNDGADVSTLRCPQDVFNKLRRGDDATLRCTYVEYGERSDFRVVDVIKIHNFKTSTDPAMKGPVGTPVNK